MFKDITLGQYFPGNSAIHRLDPRTKILLTILYIVLVFLVSRLWLFSILGVYILLLMIISRVPFKVLLRTINPLKWLILFMFIINMFFTPGATVLANIGPVVITYEGLMQATFMSIRLVLLVFGTSMLTLFTSPMALTDGIERLLAPLKKIKFPAHELAMMMTIALRFIPTLIEETDKIQKAQMARGADFETGNIVRRAKNMVPLLIPLFVSAFRRADELAMAMESRCYHGGEGRTRMKVLKMHLRDGMAAFIVFVFGMVIIFLGG